MMKDETLTQENEMEHGDTYYFACLGKIKSGTLTKEDLKEIEQKLSVSPIKGPQGKYDFVLNEEMLDRLISAIDAKPPRCGEATAENYKKFLKVLKPEISNLATTTFPFMKHLIRDIQRNLFY